MSDARKIGYSELYKDDTYEYRHVMLPQGILESLPDIELLNEEQWRAAGVCQGRGWEHFMRHRPEPHILLFRRLLKKKRSDDSTASSSSQAGSGHPIKRKASN